MNDVLIRLDNLNLTLNGRHILRHISWQLKRGESWTFLGANGAGKSTLLRLIRGDIWPDADGGKRLYCFDGRETQSPIRAREKIAVVSAEGQAKYLRQEWSLSGREVVLTGIFGSELLHQRPDPEQQQCADEIIETLALGDLAHTDAQQMSQGQLRKVLIARALVSQPEVLILDEVCVGLDAPSRRQVLQLVERIAASSTSLLFTTHRSDESTPAISNVLELHQGAIKRQGDRVSLARNDRRFLASESPENSSVISSLPLDQERESRPYLILIANTDVYRDDKPVLRDINWRMNEGENWLILGGNGAGKSTLLKLILGELHPAWGGSIYRFGSRDNHSIWEIKRRVGFISAEFQDAYHMDVPTEKVTASGFFSSIGLVDQMIVTPEQEARIDLLMELFNLRHLAGQSILRMSYGQARKVFVARALVEKPRLLLLDEPFDGLDHSSKTELSNMLEEIARSGTNMILASHYEADFLPIMTHRLVMQNGRISAQQRVNLRA